MGKPVLYRIGLGSGETASGFLRQRTGSSWFERDLVAKNDLVAAESGGRSTIHERIPDSKRQAGSDAYCKRR